jgi:hypothetical protein
VNKGAKQLRFHCKRILSGDEISFRERELAQKIYDDMSVGLGDKRPSYCTVENWVVRFRTGHLTTEGEELRPLYNRGKMNASIV